MKIPRYGWRGLAARLLTTGAALLAASSLHAKNPKVLFVGGQPEATQGADAAVMTYLQERYGEDNVTYAQANASQTADADGKDLVVLSSTPGSGDIRTKFRDVPAGVVNWEEALADAPRDGNFPFVGGGRPKSSQTDWKITDVAHWITKDFVGQSYTLWEPAAETWSGEGDLGEGVEVLATDPDDVGATLMVVETGGKLLNDLESAGRRVMFGMTDGTADSLTDEGWELFGRSLDWAASCDGTSLTEGLIGYWSFNDLKPGSSQAQDASANSNVGNVNGDPELTEGPAGEGDIAIRFDGVDDSVTTEGAIMNDIDEFTMAGWVKFDEQPGNRIGFFGQNDAIEYGMINPTTMQHWSAAGGGFDVPFGPKIEEWTSIVLVNRPDERILYVNGEEEATGGGTNPTNSGFTFNIGGDGVYDATGNFFTGEMDDVAVWGRALTADEVFELVSRRAVLPPDVRDTDGDGMGDQYETDNGLDLTDASDRDTDLDGDGLTNFQEFELRTNPNNKDSDDDGLDDNVETNTGVWVSASDTGTHPLKPDTDKDGLRDGAETNTGTLVDANDAGTDPHNPDTDGDGAKDGLEVSGGTDPHDRLDLVSAIFGGAPFTTTHFHAAGDQIGDIDSAKAATSGELDGETLTVPTPFIHFHDNANAPILQDLSRPYPLWDEAFVEGAEGPGDHNDFAIFSTGEIFLRRSGFTTFVVNSDDGFSLEIDGEEIGNAGNRGRGNTIMTVELTEGVHTVNFWQWERGGGAGVSVYIYRGTEEEPPAVNDGDYELLQSFDIFGIVTADTDEDGMDDFAENFFFGDLSRDGTGDQDGDGLNDAQELALRADPTVKDTDGDGLEDGPEVNVHETNPAVVDTDGDSIADGEEVNNLKTDPTKADTDGDTFGDNIEVALNTDPLSAESKPDAIIAVSAGAWDAPATWSDGLAPSPGKNYVAVGTVTSKLVSATGTFGGDTLTLIGPNLALELDHSGNAVANIVLNHANINLAGDASLGGSLDLRGTVLIDVGANSLSLGATLSGGAHVTFKGGSATDFQGDVELTGEGNTFGGPIDIIGTDLAGLSEGSLGDGSILLASGGVAYGYDSSSDVSLLKIQGDNFRLVLGGAVEVADVIGVDADGATLFSLNDLAGAGPYTADDLLGAFQLDEGISGAGTIALLGTGADTDGDGLRDAWETEQFGNLDQSADGDPDGDGLTNLHEQSGGTDPNAFDGDAPPAAVTRMVVHYDFNEGAGTVINNQAPGGSAGELVNAHAGAWVASGGVAGSGYLNFTQAGANGNEAQHILTGIGALDLPNEGEDADYTMMAWTRFETATPGGDSEDNMIFGQLSDGNVLHNGARADQYHMGHWGNDISGGTMVPNEWHHVAWRYKDGTQTIYVDGVEVASDVKGNLADPAEIVIGATRSDQDRDFSGDLDDIRIYDGAVSEAEILAIASSPKPRGGAGKPLYSQNFDAFANDTTDLGDGSIITSNDGTNSVQDGALRMTQTGVNGTAASFLLPAFDASAGWTATFDFTVEHIGENTPADGFSFNFGAIPGPEDFGNPAEEGYGDATPHVSYQIDTWLWNDAAAQDAGVGIEVTGVEVALTKAADDDANFKPEERVSATATLSWDPASGASFSTTGLRTNADFQNVPTPGFEAGADYGFSFLARTGGHNETVIIDNLVVSPLGGEPFPGLLGYWRLDEGEGAVAGDASGNGNDGAIENANFSWVDDATRGTVYQSGAGSFIDFGTFGPVLSLEQDFTWSFWVNPDETDNNNIVFGNRYAPSGADFAPREFVKFTPRVFEWHFNGGGENVPGDNTMFVVGEWAHNLVVKSGDTLTYYRNGVEVASSTITGAPANVQPLYLGGQNGLENFSGLFDEVAVFDRALSAAEVAEVYGFGLDLAPLTGGGGTGTGGEVPEFLGSVFLSAGGGVSFDIPDGATVDVEFSTDLVNWDTIATGVTGSYEDSDAGRAGLGAGYYRAK